MCGTVVCRTLGEILAVSALIHRFDHMFSCFFFLLKISAAAPSDQFIYFLLQSRLRLTIGFLFGSSNKEKAHRFCLCRIMDIDSLTRWKFYWRCNIYIGGQLRAAGVETGME